MQPARLLLCLVATLFLIAGCGGTNSSDLAPGQGESSPAPPASDFPAADGKSLARILRSTEATDLVVLPAAAVFYEGRNRLPFGVFHADGSPVTDAKVALYLSKEPGRAANRGGSKAKALDAPVIGPFPASIESLETKPAFRAQTTTDDPRAAMAVYVSTPSFPSGGKWRLIAIVERSGELEATLLPSVSVGRAKQIPRVGQGAPLIHTPTADSVGGDLARITTRIPPDTQNRVDYASALGKEPILLLFATPQFCESRVCGPVVDVAEQVKQENEGRAAFIHMEIYVDNEPPETRPQVKAFNLFTEPWLFAINRRGKVVDVVEGAFGVEAMAAALDKATQ